MKKCNRSGSATKDVEKAERGLAIYNFLSWLDNFVYVREGKTNLKLDEDYDESDEASLDQDNESIGDDNDYNEFYRYDNVEEKNESNDLDLLESSVDLKPKQVKRKAKQQITKSKKSMKQDYLDDMELSLIKSLKEDLKDHKKEEKDPDAVDLFVRSLGTDLRALNERDFFMAKYEIQSVVFKYQMTRFERETLVNSPSLSSCSPSGYNSKVFNFNSTAQIDRYNK